MEVGVGRQVLIVQDLDQDLGQGESGQDLDLTRQGDHPQEDHRLECKVAAVIAELEVVEVATSSNVIFVLMNFVHWQFARIICSVITENCYLNVLCAPLPICTGGIWFGIYVNITERIMVFLTEFWSRILSICQRICEKSFALNVPRPRPMKVQFGLPLILIR